MKKKLETLGAQAEIQVLVKVHQCSIFFLCNKCELDKSMAESEKKKNYQPMYTLGVSKEKGMIHSTLELQYLLG